MIQGLVSVIVPVYNSEKYLDQCVSSIAAQSHTRLEIILVDDGSRDNSPGMCDVWARKDSRVKVIHKQNAGAGFARNSGLDLANGEYICFFDSDDWIEPDAVEKAYTLAQKSNAQIVLFGSNTVDQKGNLLSRHIPRAQKNLYCGEEVISEFLPELIDGNHKDSKVENLALSLWTCMFSGELINRNGWRLVSEREYASEDSYSLLMLYQYVTRIAILPDSLYCYREIGGSLSHTYKKDTHERMTAFYHACIELCDRIGYPRKVRERIAGLFLSQEIGIMKQIVLADLPAWEKYQQTIKILQDETTRLALSQMNWRYSSRARNILIWMMRKKMTATVLLLVKAQTTKSEVERLLKGA